MVETGKIQTTTKDVEWSDIPTRIAGGGVVDNRIELDDYLLYLFEDKGAIEVVDTEKGLVKQRYIVNPLKKKLGEFSESAGEVGVHQIFFEVNNRFNTHISLDIIYQAVVKGGSIKFRYTIGLNKKGEMVAKETVYELEHSDTEVNELLKGIVETTIVPTINKLIEHVSSIAKEYQLEVNMGEKSMEIFWFDSGTPEFELRDVEEKKISGYVTTEEAKKLSQLPNIKAIRYIPTVF
ncbi:hypothetical protein E3E35_01175 [Thermococcus sp. GR7]|uniref:hypothetical protein n=1 Tax=unclassified Thermococcus TaxID=2627626 RepID=UPI0014322531|nr:MULTISPECIES: hypothetical protein [unclassified Thermococcus]NJE46041.1 hypothetical protein [Thermococcus sp. GR7]NJE79353.1 hypothetical protein [Thermococcus sp. GR4]NJF22238.1 hypothetical protein [Thermococcus sp. GR5]